MSEAPFATRDSLTRERENTAAGDETQNGEAGSQQQHKTNAFLKIFHKSPAPRTTTPRADVSGGADGSGTPGAGRSEEQEMEDHMSGSAYTATELCPACGFPRGSSVCCPVTRRHHGTNELMDSGRHQHSRSASGSKGLFAKMLSKFPVSPGRHSERPTPVNDDGGSPSTENHMPSGRDDNAGEVDGAPRHAGGGGGVSVSPESASEERLHRRTHHTDGAADEAGGAEAAAPEEGGEEQVQYYCYTDENGETFYYTQELQESMHERQSATVAARASQLETHTDAAAAGHDADADAAPPGSYLCEYVDENGNTVQYLYTPDPNAAAPPAEEAESAEAAAATTTSALAVGGGSEDGSSDATSAAASAKRKSPGSFFAAITNVFKPGRTSDSRRTTHVDPATTPGGSSAPLTALGQGTPSAGDEGADGYAAHDRDVEAHLATLDASEKKKFLKDRKNLMKELASAEKKAREALVKERHEYVEETARQKRAGAFAMEKVARAVKAGQKRGEPL